MGQNLFSPEPRWMLEHYLMGLDTNEFNYNPNIKIQQSITWDYFAKSKDAKRWKKEFGPDTLTYYWSKEGLLDKVTMKGPSYQMKKTTRKKSGTYLSQIDLVYDDRDRLTEFVMGHYDAMMATIVEIHFTYDEKGRVIKQVYKDIGITDHYEDPNIKQKHMVTGELGVKYNELSDPEWMDDLHWTDYFENDSLVDHYKSDSVHIAFYYDIPGNTITQIATSVDGDPDTVVNPYDVMHCCDFLYPLGSNDYINHPGGGSIKLDHKDPCSLCYESYDFITDCNDCKIVKGGKEDQYLIQRTEQTFKYEGDRRYYKTVVDYRYEFWEE